MDNGEKILEKLDAFEKILLTVSLTVRGDPESQDSRGIAGDVSDIKQEVKTELPKIKTNRKLIHWTWAILLVVIGWIIRGHI